MGLHCTYKITISQSVSRCKAKYCRSCLKNRYGQDLDEIKDRGIDGQSKDIAGHDKAQGYVFKYAEFAEFWSYSHCLASLDVHVVLVIVTVEGVAKLRVLNRQGTLQPSS